MKLHHYYLIQSKYFNIYFSEAAMRRINQSTSQNGHSENFAKIQGGMSEDEALAKAIYESMQQQQITAGNGSSASSSSTATNKSCEIS